MKKELLLKFNLIQSNVLDINISKDVFINYLNEITGAEEEVNIFTKPKFDYYGEYNYTNFEITENQRIFKNTSDSKIKGKIIFRNNGITLNVESYLFETREILFVIVGILMLLTGIVNFLTTKNIQNENVFVPILIGIFFPIFTYLYSRRESKLGIKNFNKRIEELKKRHHNTV